jgi:hypothetical protein
MDGGSAQESGRSWQGDRLLRAVADRIGRSATVALLVSPLGVLFVSVARLLIISDYNTATASAIAASGGYVDALLGTVIPLIPLLLPYLALVLLFVNRVIPGLLALLATALISPMELSRPAANRLFTQNLAAISGASDVALGFLAFLTLVAVLALLVTLAGIGWGTSIRILGMMICIALLPTVVRLYPLPVTGTFYTQLLRQPWLPAEMITLRSGRTFTGYILADDGNWIVVLNDAARTVLYYPSGEITAQRICTTGRTPAGPPLITLSPRGAAVAAAPPACSTQPGG